MSRLRPFCVFLLVFSGLPLLAQQPSSLTCAATAVPALVRSEGVSERLGDAVLVCSGTPGANVRFSLTLFLGVSVTNHLTASSTVDILLTVDTGSGPTPVGSPAMFVSGPSVVFQDVNFTLPASGTASLRLTNIRGNATQGGDRPIQVFFAANGPSAILVNNNPLTIAVPARGLLASFSTTFVCRSSPLPAEPSFDALLAKGTRFS